MKHTWALITVVLLLIAAIPLSCDGQYFNKVHDFDSTGDFGWDVFLQPDSGGNYLIFNGAESMHTALQELTWMTVSANGSTVISKHVFANPLYNVYEGDPGAIKMLADGSYIIPIYGQRNSGLGYYISWAGLLKINSSLDTVFTKNYTDTSHYFEVIWDLAVMPDGGFLLGGVKAPNDDAINQGLLIRTNSLGDTLWTHTYSYDPTKSCTISTVEALSNGRLLVGACSTTPFTAGGHNFNDNEAWFLVLDSLGNIIKDTLYGPRYAGGGISMRM